MRARFASLALVTLLTSCAVGPNFRRPAVPGEESYREVQSTNSSAVVQPDEPRIEPGTEIKFDWWNSLHSPALDQLEARAIAASPQIDAAQARLRRVQAQLRASYGALFLRSE